MVSETINHCFLDDINKTTPMIINRTGMIIHQILRSNKLYLNAPLLLLLIAFCTDSNADTIKPVQRITTEDKKDTQASNCFIINPPPK